MRSRAEISDSECVKLAMLLEAELKQVTEKVLNWQCYQKQN